jgi:hypothetical protein
MKFFLVIVFILYVSKIVACDCILYPISNYVDTTSYILVFKVDSITDKKNEDYEYIFEKNNKGYTAIGTVIEVVKAKSNLMNKIVFDSDFSNCDFLFKKGESYLIFAHKRGSVYYVNKCSYSDLLKNSKCNIRRIKHYLKKSAAAESECSRSLYEFLLQKTKKRQCSAQVFRPR